VYKKKATTGKTKEENDGPEKTQKKRLSRVTLYEGKTKERVHKRKKAKDASKEDQARRGRDGGDIQTMELVE